MFKVSKSGHPAISAVRSDRLIREESKSASGTTSRSVTSKSSPRRDQFESTSNTSMRVTGSPNTNISGNAVTIDVDPMLTGMTPQTETVLHTVYRDIYYNDSVAGSAVDLTSTLPFGEFNLGGFPSVSGDVKAVQEKYLETIERLNFRTLLPEIAIDYLVLGEHCSSLLYNREKKVFTDILPHQAEDLVIEPLPLYSQDPIITVKFPPHIREIMSRTTPRIERIKENLGADIVEKILGGELELDPLSTIYLPRKTFTRALRGTSYYRRILPIYLIEKNLFRGTLVESARRQRGILHLSLGDGETWVPTVQDMEFMTELFMNADSDPVGAIIATRSGISVEELRQGGDFWKSTDFADSVLSHKLRALGISEGFLSGEASYDTSGTALMVFLDSIRTFRETMTRKLFYDTMFPLISLINGYTVKNGKLKIDPNLIHNVNSEEALQRMNDGSKLFIPSVQWTKQLKPEGDSAYMEMLNALSDKGVPVPLRALAAAGGLDLETLIRQQDEDIDIRKKVGKYLERLAELQPKPAEGEGEAEASERQEVLSALASVEPSGQTRSSVQAKHGKRSLLSRNFDNCEPYKLSKTGKPKRIYDVRAFNEKSNRMIVRALKDLKNK